MNKSHIGKFPLMGISGACLMVAGIFTLQAVLEKNPEPKLSDSQRVEEKSLSNNDLSHPQHLVQQKSAPKTSKSFDSAKIMENDGELTNLDYADLLSEGVKEQFRQVATHYADNMRFPSYSKPLNSNDWSLLNPHPFVPQPSPLAGGKAGEIELSASIVLSSYLVSATQPLPITVMVSGKEPTPIKHISAAFQTRSGVLSATKLNSNDENQTGEQIFSGVIPTSTLSTIPSGEQRIVAQIMLSTGESLTTSAGIKLYRDEATLTHVSDSYVDHADLVIPVQFELYTPGFYQINGNLFDEKTGTPVSHINSRFVLTEEAPNGLLKIHSETLRSKGFEGPYLLKDITITRKSSRPGEPEGHGSSLKHQYLIAGFPLSDYSDEPYQNAQNQQRLEFLQKMAGGI